MAKRTNSSCQFPELKSVQRLSKIPVVQLSAESLNKFYEKAKEQNVERLQGVIDVASSVVKGVAMRITSVLGRPIKIADSILDKSLSFVELKIPAVHDPPNKLHEEIKNYIYTFWGGEVVFTMVERLASTFRHVMDIIFISSLDENIKSLRNMNAKSNSYCSEQESSNEGKNEEKEKQDNNEQNPSAVPESLNESQSSFKSADKVNDSSNHSKQQ